ncbi:acetyltransferase [Herbaspirillum rubrisubalbicans]|nr:acetyltransferase [Herbaspirillum rubrisubalbicans]
MQSMNIEKAGKEDYAALIDIWERSVRATHDFLSDEQIAALRPLILNHYFDAVDLRITRQEDGEITGFVGVAGDQVEMLFVCPSHHHKGIGSLLMRHAIEHQGARRVDVNEQNPAAIGFYLHLGFVQMGRSEHDGQGNPFPLLHLRLASTTS